MKWLSVRIKTTTEAEDLLIGSLYLRGFEGAQIEDHIPLTPLEKEQMFVDILPDEKEDDGVAYLTFYIEMEDGRCRLGAADGETQQSNLKSVEEIREILDEELSGLEAFDIDAGELTVEISETEDLDWINNWKQYFHQFYIDDLLVIPSWEEVKPEDRDKQILHIDPGTAFGTGMHETTQLCIRQLKRFISDGREREADESGYRPFSDAQLLDIGTGSGILGILGLMFGADSVKATDLDPCAIAAVEDNLDANGIDKGRFELKIGNIINDISVQDWAGYECFDIVCANILADILVPLMPAAYHALKPGGVIITSGIIEGREDMVTAAMKECGLKVIEVSSLGEWRSVTGVK